VTNRIINIETPVGPCLHRYNYVSYQQPLSTFVS